jgi:hypothetical protein
VVTSLDISPLAVAEAERKGLFGYQADASKFEIADLDFGAITHIEMHGLVLMEGLLVNLVDSDGVPHWKRALKVADIFLHPNDWMFGAVVIRQDQLTNEGLSQPQFKNFDYSNHQDRWRKRYKENEKLGLPYGSVIVASPGENKKNEWESAKALEKLRQSEDFERLVGHVDPNELFRELKEMGPKEFVWYPTLFPSRDEDRQYIGVVFGWQKPDTFRYAPWYKGHTSLERAEINKIRQWYVRARPFVYTVNYWNRLSQNIGDPSIAPWVEENLDRAISGSDTFMKKLADEIIATKNPIRIRQLIEELLTFQWHWQEYEDTQGRLENL